MTKKKCKVERIDKLLDNEPSTTPILESETDKEVIGVIQDLLVGFNYYPSLLGLRNADHRGKFDTLLKKFILRFRKKHQLNPSNQVLIDAAALQKMVSLPVKNPIASRIYLTRYLDLELTSFVKFVWLTAAWECDGQFKNCETANKDKAGLSYGILQWTHRSGRLFKIMKRYQEVDVTLLRQCFGGETNTNRMLHHAEAGAAALNEDGTSTDPSLEFLNSEWKTRFQRAAAFPKFQKAQAELAVADFQDHLARMRAAEQSHPSLIVSERGVAFMLDFINQFGLSGAMSIHNQAHQTATTEEDLMRKIKDQVQDRYRKRRQFFMETGALSNDPFHP